MVVERYIPSFINVRVQLSTIIAPIQYIANWPIVSLENMINNFSSREALLKDNANLRVRLLLLKADVQKNLDLRKENKQLRQLLSSADKQHESVFVAQVLAVANISFIHQIIINQGSQQKVWVGQAVLDDGGIMGQVVQVGLLTSRVMLLTDIHSSIPVKMLRNGIRGLAIGTGHANTLSLRYIPQTTDIKVGDKLMSSGLGLRYPEGYPVGTVIQVLKVPGNAFLNITVRPSAHLQRSRLVLLLLLPQDNVDKAVVKQLQSIRQQAKQLQTRSVTYAR